MSIVLSITLFGFSAANWRHIQTGFWLLDHRGPQAAYQFFQERIRTDKRDADLLYSYAWAAYRSQAYQESEEICQYLLSRTTAPELRSHVFYLEGALFTDTGRFQDAMACFEVALIGYRDLENHKNVHRTFLGMAKVAILAGDLAKANQYLAQAEAYSIGGFSLEIYFRMKSWLAFKLGSYLEALEFAERGLAISRENPSLLGQALSGVGFYLMLSGRYEEGLQRTTEAELKIVSAFNPQDYYYNLLNKILYDRCNGGNYSMMADAINSFATEHQDKMLLDYLAFTLAFDCNAR